MLTIIGLSGASRLGRHALRQGHQRRHRRAPSPTTPRATSSTPRSRRSRTISPASRASRCACSAPSPTRTTRRATSGTRTAVRPRRHRRQRHAGRLRRRPAAPDVHHRDLAAPRRAARRGRRRQPLVDQHGAARSSADPTRECVEAPMMGVQFGRATSPSTPPSRSELTSRRCNPANYGCRRPRRPGDYLVQVVIPNDPVVGRPMYQADARGGHQRLRRRPATLPQDLLRQPLRRRDPRRSTSPASQRRTAPGAVGATPAFAD